MITDEMVSAALGFLAIDPHPLAEARYRVTKAENRRKLTYAVQFLGFQGQGSVTDRQAMAESSGAYQDALREYENAEVELERQKARIKSAENVIELYRTEQANQRVAERIR